MDEAAAPLGTASRSAPAAMIADLSAADLAARIRDGALSARQATAATLDAIAALDGELHAFCALSPTALAEAEAIDRRLAAGDPVGPLAGVPVAVKDLISTAGLRTTFGSRLYANHIPAEDDVVVERLRAAGAVVVGKTNTSEFGYGAFGHNPLFPTTRNPWNLDLTPGGSSAGSAAAVAAGVVPLALGSDGGGSVRVPAALSGIVGFKPSWGRVPVYPGCRDPELPGPSGWESLEHIGPLGRTVGDVALMMSVLAGPDARDRHSLPDEGGPWWPVAPTDFRGQGIAWSPDLGFAAVDPEVRRLTASAVARLERALGLRVDAAHPGISDPQPTFEALVALDTDRAGLRRLAAGERLSAALHDVLSRSWTADDFTSAILTRKAVANRMAAFLARYRFLLTPTTATAAFAIDSPGPAVIDGRPVPFTAWTAFSAVANLTGLPAISVPAGFTEDGRTLGLQIIGRHLDDRGTLAFAAAVETVLGADRRLPAVHVSRLAEVAA